MSVQDVYLQLIISGLAFATEFVRSFLWQKTKVSRQQFHHSRHWIVNDDPGRPPSASFQVDHEFSGRAERAHSTAALCGGTEDYGVVRELVADVFAEGMDATVPATVRETADALSSLKEERGISW